MFKNLFKKPEITMGEIVKKLNAVRDIGIALENYQGFDLVDEDCIIFDVFEIHRMKDGSVEFFESAGGEFLVSLASSKENMDSPIEAIHKMKPKYQNTIYKQLKALDKLLKVA